MAEVYEDVADEAQDVTQTDDAANESQENEAVENVAQEAEGDGGSSLSDLQFQHYELIQEIEVKCDELEHDFNVKNSDMKEAKKRWEAKVDELRRCIRSGPEAQRQLPFREDGEVDNAKGADLFSDDWQAAPITDALTLTKKQQEKLEDAGVKTVGEFEQLRAGTTDYPRGLRDLPGVGDAKVDKWEEEILDWLAKNQPVEEDEPSDDEQFDGMGRMVAGAISN